VTEHFENRNKGKSDPLGLLTYYFGQRSKIFQVEISLAHETFGIINVLLPKLKFDARR
jgi:hypothetical protein